MLDYEIKTDIVEITLESGKKVKVAKKWVDNTIEALKTDIEDVLLMWLEDNDYLVNEEQEELDAKAKKVVKNVVKSSNTERKVTTRERKPNVPKQEIISLLTQFLLENGAFFNIIVENDSKIITFTYLGKDFKIDLTEKRVKKQ
jgi:hypothetical protein